MWIQEFIWLSLQSACSLVPSDSRKGRVILMSFLELTRVVTGGGKMENMFPCHLEGSESEVQVWAGHARPALNPSKPSTELHLSPYHEGLELKHSFGASI